jgi:hypothetical protein
MQGIPFELREGRWYGWQMLPGYLAEGREVVPYFSPIRVHRVTRLKSGRGLLAVSLFNACYASGVKDQVHTLRVLARHYEYMVAAIEGSDDRTVILSGIAHAWVRRFCPQLEEWRPSNGSAPDPGTDVSVWLDAVFSN